MPHGGPDWGTAGPLATVYTLEDMAELAVRLGSPIIFDRRGNVIFIEDFNGSLAKCAVGTSGAGGSVIISSEKSRHGDFSCKMVTGDAEDDYAYVDLCLPYPVLCKVGLEISWYLESYLKDIELYILLYDGSTRWFAAVRWHNEDDTWQYLDAADNWIPLSPAVPYGEGDYIFNHAKLVIDLATKEYVRLIANNLNYDLTGKAIQSAPAWVGAQLYCEIATVTRVDDNCIVYLDNMIVTQNEP